MLSMTTSSVLSKSPFLHLLKNVSSLSSFLPTFFPIVNHIFFSKLFQPLFNVFNPVSLYFLAFGVILVISPLAHLFSPTSLHLPVFSAKISFFHSSIYWGKEEYIKVTREHILLCKGELVLLMT